MNDFRGYFAHAYARKLTSILIHSFTSFTATEHMHDGCCGKSIPDAASLNLASAARTFLTHSLFPTVCAASRFGQTLPSLDAARGWRANQCCLRAGKSFGPPNLYKLPLMLAIFPTDRIFILAGAGVSAECSIPTFRGVGGLWRNYRIEEGVVVIRTSSGQSHASGQRDFVRRQPTQEIEIGNHLRQDNGG